jgi:hypothetical protein
MKSLLSAAVCIWFAFNVSGQGTLIWNPPTSPTTTNGLGGNGPISGAGNYMFGLYVGSVGAPVGSFTLAGLTLNGNVVGSYLAQNSVVVPPPGAGTIALQVRGWSAFAGLSYESALAYALAGNSPIAFLGQSTIDTYTIGSPTPYRAPAFELTPVPEPSTLALAIVGAGALAIGIRSRRKRFQ